MIQATFRGYAARKAYKAKKLAAAKIQATAKSWIHRRQLTKLRDAAAQEETYQRVMQRHQERIQQLERERRALAAVPPAELSHWEAGRHRAAARIQACWRGALERRRLAAAHGTLGGVAVRNASFAAPPLGLEASATSVFLPLPEASRASAAHLLLPQPEPSRAAVVAEASQVHGGAVGMSTDSLTAAMARGGGGGSGGGYHRAVTITPQRMEELQRRIDRRLEADRAAAAATAEGHNRTADLDPRLTVLLEERRQRRPEALRQANERQKILQTTELLCTQLEHLPRPDQLPPSVTPQHFPLPPASSGRMARARHAHAMALADAKVGSSRWWQPLKALNRHDAQLPEEHMEGYVRQDWDEKDQAWKKQWQRIVDLEKARPPVSFGSAALVS